VKAN
jgi:hypothetical protein